jgi:hypothetical protein
MQVVASVVHKISDVTLFNDFAFELASACCNRMASRMYTAASRYRANLMSEIPTLNLRYVARGSDLVYPSTTHIATTYMALT